MKSLAVAFVLAITPATQDRPEPPTCREAIAEAFAGTGQVARMQAISWRESRNVPAARNGQHRGCLQIATGVHRAKLTQLGWTPADMDKPYRNAVIGRWLYNLSGTSPWKATR